MHTWISTRQYSREREIRKPKCYIQLDNLIHAFILQTIHRPSMPSFALRSPSVTRCCIHKFNSVSSSLPSLMKPTFRRANERSSHSRVERTASPVGLGQESSRYALRKIAHVVSRARERRTSKSVHRASKAKFEGAPVVDASELGGGRASSGRAFMTAERLVSCSSLAKFC